MTLAPWGAAAAQGWPQLAELGLTLVLSAAIGLERAIRHKSAELRTHTLVGSSQNFDPPLTPRCYLLRWKHRPVHPDRGNLKPGEGTYPFCVR
jgi:hypothetical protein